MGEQQEGGIDFHFLRQNHHSRGCRRDREEAGAEGKVQCEDIINSELRGDEDYSQKVLEEALNKDFHGCGEVF